MFKILNANLLNSDIKLIVEKVVKSCETCIIIEKTITRTIVAFSKLDDFNETMSLDLHHLQPGLWCMHMIDESISQNEIEYVEWINTKQQLAVQLMKSGANTKLLLNTIITGSISVNDPLTTVIHIVLYFMTQVKRT